MIHKIINNNLFSFRTATIAADPNEATSSIATTVGSNNRDLIRTGVRQKKRNIALTGRMSGTNIGIHTKQLGVPGLDMLERVDNVGYVSSNIAKYLNAVYEYELIKYEKERARNTTNEKIEAQLVNLEQKMDDIGSMPVIVSYYFTGCWSLDMSEYLGPKLQSTNVYTNRVSTFRSLAEQRCIDAFPSASPQFIFDQITEQGLDFDETTHQTHNMAVTLDAGPGAFDSRILETVLLDEVVTDDSEVGASELNRLIDGTELQELRDGLPVNKRLTTELALLSDPNFDTSLTDFRIGEHNSGRVVIINSETNDETVLTLSFDSISDSGRQIREAGYFKQLIKDDWHTRWKVSQVLYSHSRIPLVRAKVLGARR